MYTLLSKRTEVIKPEVYRRLFNNVIQNILMSKSNELIQWSCCLPVFNVDVIIKLPECHQSLVCIASIGYTLNEDDASILNFHKFLSQIKIKTFLLNTLTKQLKSNSNNDFRISEWTSINFLSANSDYPILLLYELAFKQIVSIIISDGHGWKDLSLNVTLKLILEFLSNIIMRKEFVRPDTNALLLYLFKICRVLHHLNDRTIADLVLNCVKNILVQDYKACCAVQLSDTLACLDSTIWQERCVGMTFLWAYLHLPRKVTKEETTAKVGKQLRSTSANASVNTAATSKSAAVVGVRSNAVSKANTAEPTSKTALPKSQTKAISLSNSKPTVTSNPNHVSLQTCVSVLSEVCMGGHMKLLCTGVLDPQSDIRGTVLSVLRLCNEIAFAGETTAVLWTASAMEQGLIPLLEVIAAGMPVSTANASTAVEVMGSSHSNDISSPQSTSTINNDAERLLFPESTIRTMIQEWLTKLTLMLKSNVPLRHRNLVALSHSGSSELHINVFTGLLLIQGRDQSIGSLLWTDARQTSKKDEENVFYDMLAVNGTENDRLLRMVVAITALVVDGALAWSQSIDQPIAIATAKPASVTGGRDGQTLKDRIAGGPTVAVAETADTSLLVKMQCPAPSAVRVHSAVLATMLQKILDAQTISHKSAAKDTLPLSSLPRLQGSYLAWQELFSHLVDDFLLESSVRNLSVAMLCDTFVLADTFGMTRLRDRYASALASLLTPDSFTQIFGLSIGSYVGRQQLGTQLQLGQQTGTARAPSPNTLSDSRLESTSPHLKLCSECLQVLMRDFDRIFIRKRHVRVTDILKQLHILMKLMLCEIS